MAWILRFLKLLLSFLFLPFIPVTTGGDNHPRFVLVDGRERTYVVHLPPLYNGQRILPVVIVLHGGGADVQNAMRVTGMNEKADREGFIAVYPEGSSRTDERLFTWNAGDGYCCGFAEENQIDDVKFIHMMILQLVDEFHVDMHRIFVTGISNGAMMSYRLGCELSDIIAAIGPVAGALGAQPCQPERPLPVIIVHGTADLHVLYEGGAPVEPAPGEADRVDPPVAFAVSFWVEHNECSRDPQRSETGNILREAYTGGREDAEVILYTIKGGGHAWPGGEKGSPTGDEPTPELSATDQMWDFFTRHPRDP